MTYTSDCYEIEYDSQNEGLVQDVAEALNQNLACVMAFLELEKLDKKIPVKIHPTLESWRDFIITHGGRYQDWVVGWVPHDTIHVLAYDQYARIQSHQNDTLEDFQKVIIHESVHFCHSQICTNRLAFNSNFFFREGLATYLAEQPYNPKINTDFPKDVIFDPMKFLQNTNDPYSVAQKLVRKVLGKVSHEQFLEYVRDPQKLYDDWEKLQ